ncbi:hexitol phosphatase HxpB [Myroides marinus]|uniref:hexitol phosphatase HxpB n=1 Tax=Myroides marinus TaxID=703342 RepID=UPI00257783A0|nr:hexitol phosphatase HxpB [Myroides marinus]MDM1368886.1 hexitol phosphatase HxpB [Myroides marinus]MDM1375632.1 hexitol phosphatase HxpB [Myroides marinus]MDM1382858.1 hexitol phosphatase HxpB [Myroides marinus]
MEDKKITTVLFDMDGVLIDSEGFWQQAEEEVFTSMGATWDEAIAIQTQGKTTRAVTELWYNLYPWEGKSIEEVEQMVIDRVDELISTEGEIKEGVIQTLEFLEERNIKIGLATNSPESLIVTVLKRLGIKKYFQTIVSSEHVEHGKPAPDVYLRAAHNLGSQSSECLVVEDSFTGVTAGKNAKMTVVAIPDAEQYNQERFDIADFKLNSMIFLNEKIVPFLQ